MGMYVMGQSFPFVGYRLSACVLGFEMYFCTLVIPCDLPDILRNVTEDLGSSTQNIPGSQAWVI
jgi:hypothetical protein